MADWISVAEAAHELGVSPRRVRHLVDSGALPARRLGVGWLLPADAVHARARHAPSPGRPLSAPLAWAVLRVAQELLDEPREPAEAERVNELLRVEVRLRRRLLAAAEPGLPLWLRRPPDRDQNQVPALGDRDRTCRDRPCPVDLPRPDPAHTRFRADGGATRPTHQHRGRTASPDPTGHAAERFLGVLPELRRRPRGRKVAAAKWTTRLPPALDRDGDGRACE